MKYIKNRLNNTKAIQADIALKIENVWNLDLDERWQLYKFWVQEFINERKVKTLSLQQDLKTILEVLKEKRAKEDLSILKNCFVVGMTTTGAAKYRSLVQELNPAILIIEEAAEILESHTVASFAPNTKHVILIGDQQQLRPSPTVHMLAVKYGLNISLFERMIENDIEYCRLSIQHRMRPEIAALIVPHIYPNLENHKITEELENIKGVNKNVFFISHKFSEQPVGDSKSRVNQHEAKFLICLCKYLILQGYDPSQITILTTYSGQLFVLKQFATGIVPNVRITVVDNFQGEENDIILISFVRSNNQGEIGFLKVPNRVCVALSRAKKGLFCIGNFELLAQKSDLWKNIVKTLSSKGSIGPSLKLMCQNHPETFSDVSTEMDFEVVPDGGCTRICEYRLACGHLCPLSCHPYDHSSVRCEKPCTKTCEMGHPCSKKCFEKCGPCKTLVDRKLSRCQHTMKAYCGQNESEIFCTFPCEKELQCKHICSNLCYENCVCKTKIKVSSPICGHTLEIECYSSNSIDELFKRCSEPCQEVLFCNHICTGTCSSCYQGRLHVACKHECERTLVCGHKCESLCSNSCPPCQRPCENRCSHTKCSEKCGEACKVCTQPCEWACIHKKCTHKCYKECNREPCNEPCPNILPCLHSCIGFCGEVCPTECLICDGLKLQDMDKGEQCFINSSSKYVLLEECGHIFEVNYLNKWFETNSLAENEIQMKKCPKCATVIRKNVRYEKSIKKCLAEMERIKRINKWNKEINLRTQKYLLRRMMIYNLKFDFCEPLLKCLQLQKIRNIQELTIAENIIDIAIEFKKFYTVGLFSKYSCILKEHFKYVHFSGKILSELIQNNFLNATEQQLSQAALEMCRLNIIYKLSSYKKETFLFYKDLKKLEEYIYNYTPLNIKKINADRTSQKFLFTADIDMLLDYPVLYKCMTMSVGHWYICPKSHVYCIATHGNGTQSNCYICKNKLEKTNRSSTVSKQITSQHIPSQIKARWSSNFRRYGENPTKSHDSVKIHNAT